MRSLSRRTRWLIGAAAVALAVVVGGPFVYIHFIEGAAPAPLSLSSQSTATTVAGDSSVVSSSSGSVAGTWQVSSGSEAGYRVNENLFGQDATAVGRTTAITGSITIAGTTVRTGSFSVDMTKVSSDRSQRDSQFHGRIMQTSTFPTATFTLTQPIELAALPATSSTVTEKATGNLTLHGTTKLVTFTVTARRTASRIQVSGSIPVTFADWNISNPSFGPVTTDDHGTMEFLLDLVHA
ncbi:MAG: YceI family protein [Acidimicrobiales bacterium]